MEQQLPHSTELTHNINGIIEGVLLPTKTNAQTLGKLIANDAITGFATPLETWVRLKAIIEACNVALGELESTVIDELSKHPKQQADVLSAEVMQKEEGVRFDYSNDKKWEALKSKVEVIDSEMKEREKFLKGLSKPIVETDMETGESIEVFPPIRTSKTTVRVKLGE